MLSTAPFSIYVYFILYDKPNKAAQAADINKVSWLDPEIVLSPNKETLIERRAINKIMGINAIVKLGCFSFIIVLI